MAAKPDAYGEFIDNSGKTVTVAEALVNLTVRPVTSFWQKYDASKTLGERLGEWADEAKERRLAPVGPEN
jgi:hypothetical protein